MGNTVQGASFGVIITGVVGSIITVASGGILTPVYVGGLMATGVVVGAVVGGVNNATEQHA